MKTIKFLFAALLITTVLSSCGIFKKDCNCPHFSNANAVKTPARAA